MSGSFQTDQPGTYGVQRISASTNTPGARQNAVAWTDPSGNFWLFGDNGMDSAMRPGVLNDMWKYGNGEWTWFSGGLVVNEGGMYGTQGTLAPGNIPGSRGFMSGWTDKVGNLWLFGGYGLSGGTEGDLSDLWMYMP